MAERRFGARRLLAAGALAAGGSSWSAAGCSTRARIRLAMNRAVRTGVPLRVTSLTSTTPRRFAMSTRRPALVAVTSYVRAPSPASITISTRSPFTPPPAGSAGTELRFDFYPNAQTEKRLCDRNGRGASARKLQPGLSCGWNVASVRRRAGFRGVFRRIIQKTGMRSRISRVKGSGGIMLTDFYISFSAICFVILSLWLVVVQMRYDDWKDDPEFSLARVRCRAVLFAARDHDADFAGRPEQPLPVADGIRHRRAGRDRRHQRRFKATQDSLGNAAYPAPRSSFTCGRDHRDLQQSPGLVKVAVRVEAVLLCVLVFLGVNVAWLLAVQRPRRRVLTRRVLPRQRLPGRGRVTRARPRPVRKTGAGHAVSMARLPGQRAAATRPATAACSGRRRSGPAKARSRPSRRTGSAGRRTCRSGRDRTARSG